MAAPVYLYSSEVQDLPHSYYVYDNTVACVWTTRESCQKTNYVEQCLDKIDCQRKILYSASIAFELK